MHCRRQERWLVLECVLLLNCKHPSQRDFSEKLVEVMLRWSPSSAGEACLRRDESVFFSLSGSSESRFNTQMVELPFKGYFQELISSSRRGQHHQCERFNLEFPHIKSLSITTQERNTSSIPTAIVLMSRGGHRGTHRPGQPWPEMIRDDSDVRFLSSDQMKNIC